MNNHICLICGYRYDDALPFEQLGDDYECPICGVKKDKFATLTHHHKEALLNIDYGLYLLSTNANGVDNGCIIDALIQLSDNPPVVAFALNKTNYTHQLVSESKAFNISILNQDAPKELFKTFAMSSGTTLDKFASINHKQRSHNGIYYLNEYANTYLSGKVLQTIDASTHTLFIGSVDESQIINSQPTLSYSTYRKEVKYKHMFCNQCQQTAKGAGCTMVGVCGKKADTAYEQDVLIVEMIALARIMEEKGETCSPAIDQLVDGLFTTITNVNFDTLSIIKLAGKIKDKRIKLGGKPIIDPSDLFVGNEDIISLRSTLLFGLKGMAAYAHHARILGKRHSEVDHFFIKGMSSLAKEMSVQEWLELLMEFGKVNYLCMELLEAANVEAYGIPTPTTIELGVEPGPFIVVTGHDLHDLEMLLEQSKDKGVNIYTHGEMLPAHGYPKLKAYKNLKGHFGTAWQNQQNEFKNLPGAILFTTNCLMPPKDSYFDNVYTTSIVKFPDVKHIEEVNGYKDFTDIINHAIKLQGYPTFHAMTGMNGGTSVTTGFGKQTILDNAPTIIEAIKSNAIKHFFLVGGCDGAKPERSYYTDFVKQTPADSIVLTLACGKFRFNDLDLGHIGPFPRILDIGQCNDAYAAIQVAIALSQAFNCSINELPLTLVLSWYEQKAVCILLTLLSLGVKNIYVGPSVPAFFSSNVLTTLAELFGIKPISTPEKDLAEILKSSRE